MTGRHLASALLAAVVAAHCWAAADEVRVFKIRHRPVREAPVVLEPLLSPTGSLLLQPGQNTVTVRDEGPVVERIATALAEWDVPPISYRIEVRAFLASAKAPPSGPGFGPSSAIDEAIRKVGRYEWIEEIGSVDITAEEGILVETAVAGEYSVRFVPWAARGDVRRAVLSQLEFSRRRAGARGEVVLEPLIRGSVRLKLGQTAVVGATPSESADRALFLAFVARRGGAK